MNRFQLMCRNILEPEWSRNRTLGHVKDLNCMKQFHVVNFFNDGRFDELIIHLDEVPDKYFFADFMLDRCIREWCSQYEDIEEARRDFIEEGGAVVDIAKGSFRVLL